MYLSDVARVEIGAESYNFTSRYFGRPASGFGVRLAPGANALETAELVKAKVAELTQRLNESESRLAASRNRVRDLTANNAQLSSQMAAYDSTIASFKTIIDNQKTEIASLTEQINALQAENTTPQVIDVPVNGVDKSDINPWFYNSSHPVHNPDSYDLWAEFLVGKKTNIVCNWSDKVIVK